MGKQSNNYKKFQVMHSLLKFVLILSL